MNLLLDTQIFLWMTLEPGKLSGSLREQLRHPQNRLLLSVASMWEMQLKHQIGKLPLPQPVQAFVSVQRQVNSVESLPIFERHIWALDSLPLHHKDPFDRLLVAQAIADDYALVSVDGLLAVYPVRLLTGEDDGGVSAP